MNIDSGKLKVECAENCRNSPKKQLLKELTIAFAKNDTGFCIDCMNDNVVWDIIGDKQIRGIRDFEEILKDMKNREVHELRIYNIITHGNTGSVNGTLILKNDQQVDFCDVYNFSGFGKNSKIKFITSYVITAS